MLIKNIKFLLFAFGLFCSFVAYAESPINALFHNANDPVAGNPKGKVTVVEFFDYRCYHCSNMAPIIASVIRSNPNIRVVFKEYPVRGSVSELASRMALAAHKQHKYYQFSHALLTTNLSLNEKNLLDIARSLGLDIPKLKADMKSSSVVKQINANYDLARALNLTGTPAFFIGRTDETNTRNLDFVLGQMSANEIQNAARRASN